MNRKGYIGALVLSLYVSLMFGQQALDTVCVNGDPTHLAIPYQPGLTYQWSVSGGQIIGRADTNHVLVKWGATPGLHRSEVVVRDGNGCLSDTAYAWMYLRGPNRASAKGPAIVCKGATITLESALPDNFQWSGGKKSSSLSFTVNRDTTIMLIALNGACGNDTFYHTINAVDVPEGSFSNIEDTLQLDELRRLYYTGQPVDYIDWYLNGQPISQGTSVLLNFDQKGQYDIMQVVSNGSNCWDTIKKTVYVVAEFTLYIPNAFSPNGDGVNDYFEFDGVGIEKFTAVIYNRWGEVIYSFNEHSAHGWDGTNNGKPSKIDAYTYDIVVESTEGKVVRRMGAFSLIR